jgi:hypothetical protein
MHDTANVLIREVGGNLVFYDRSGNEIVTIDGENRRLSFPPASGLVTPEHIDATDIADGAVTVDKLGDGAVTAAKASGAIVRTATVDVDCGAGGTAQTTAIVVLPVNSVVLEVHARATETFNGNATQDMAVGVTGTAAKYLASADFENGANDINSGDEAFASALGSPTVPVSVAAGETVIATWTNTAAATTGIVRVSVTYYTEE